MTNADYYVNVYRDGALSAVMRTRTGADRMALVDTSDAPWVARRRDKRIGVWHVRLKKGKD